MCNFFFCRFLYTDTLYYFSPFRCFAHVHGIYMTNGCKVIDGNRLSLHFIIQHSSGRSLSCLWKLTTISMATVDPLWCSTFDPFCGCERVVWWSHTPACRVRGGLAKQMLGLVLSTRLLQSNRISKHVIIQIPQSAIKTRSISAPEICQLAICLGQLPGGLTCRRQWMDT